jgi:uncharacterized protein
LLNLIKQSKFLIQLKDKAMISKELLDILCCPDTKADLVLDGNTLVSVDKNTRRRYRIEDDIPIMLIEESEQLGLEEWTAIMNKHGKTV